jgi:REP element-mobilizing transposase RayT
MPRVNRSEICACDEVQAFHLINRCVRRTYLCGKDKRSGKDYSHRKQWIRNRLEELAGIFGLDVLGFAVMSNHMHVVVRTRPDIVKTWSDGEVARRWWNLFPQRRDRDGSAAEPTEFELNAIRNDKPALTERRRRLADISWFMRCLAEPVARWGNKEDDVTGRFWEGRFKAQPLLDETAIAACMAYVDLNPIRARIAKTCDTSDFTSVQARMADRRSAEGIQQAAARHERTEHGPRAGWLAPIGLKPAARKSRTKATPRRLSNKGCLPMTLDQYVSLVEWTGRQIIAKRKPTISAESLALLEQLELSPETWVDLVEHFRKRFRQEAGLTRNRQEFRRSRRAARISSGSV